MRKAGAVLAVGCIAIATAWSPASSAPGDPGVPTIGLPTGIGQQSRVLSGVGSVTSVRVRPFGPGGFTSFRSGGGATFGGTSNAIPGLTIQTPVNGVVRFPGGTAFGRFRDPSRFRFFNSLALGSPSFQGGGPRYFDRGRYNGMPAPPRFRAGFPGRLGTPSFR